MRYFLNTSSKLCEISHYSRSINVQDPLGCICRGPYNLNSMASLDIQHMCPRPRCRRFYHSRCLLQHGYWTRMSHPSIHLSSSPDTDETVHLPPPSKLKKRTRATSSTGCFTSSWESIKELLPHNLLQLAAQPIVRGAALPLLGITGNCQSVVFARRIVHATIQNAAPVPGEWEDEVDLDGAMVDSLLPALELHDTGEELVFMCPNCSGPI